MWMNKKFVYQVGNNKKSYTMMHGQPNIKISFVMSVRMEHLGSHRTDFHEIWYLNIFGKSVAKNSSFIKVGQEWRVLCIRTNLRFLSYLDQFFLEWKKSLKKVVQKLETHFMFNFFFENHAVYEICGKM